MSDGMPVFQSAIMAEKAVLSAMMQRPAMIARAKADGIDEGCFYHIGNRVLFDAIQTATAFTERGEIDIVGLVQGLSIDGRLEDIGGPSEVHDVYGYCMDMGAWGQWCGTLREMKARRLAVTASNAIAEASDSEEAIAATKTALEGLQRAIAGKVRSVTVRDAARDFIARFEADHTSGEIPGKSTGIFELDAICGGMRPGEFWVIGGRPSSGKSVLMLQIAAEFLDRAEPVAVFSLEMMAHEIIGRLVTVMGRVAHGHITQPRTAMKGDMQRIAAAIDKLKDVPLWIDASAGQTCDSVLAEAEMIRDSHGSLGLVVVDYIQLIRGGRAKGENREEEIARVSGGLKQLAKKLGCPVISASQLNDAGQTRESRAIEQDADSLLVISDDGIGVKKLRNGSRGDLLPLRLNGEAQKFVAYQPDESREDKAPQGKRKHYHRN